MAQKKKEQDVEDAETNKSIGSQMKSKLTQRDRNLAVKQEMIEKGEREEPKQPSARTQKEKNLLVKAELKKQNEKGKPQGAK
jgi:hypothetical protein